MGAEEERRIQNRGEQDEDGLPGLYDGSPSGQGCQYSIVTRGVGPKVSQSRACILILPLSRCVSLN